MDDPFNALGLKVATVVAGFVGGVLSLAHISNLTPKVAFAAVLAGAFAAGYVTPLVVEYIGISGSLENAVAFFLGVGGMNLVGGVFKLSEHFKKAPLATILKAKESRRDD